MSTATSTSTSAPPHAQQANQTGARPAHLQGQRAQAPADLFAALLALAADPGSTGTNDPLTAATDDDAPAGQQPDDGKDHPLAGLMFWQPQGPLEQTAAELAAGKRSQQAEGADRANAGTLREASLDATNTDHTNHIDTRTPPANARASGPSWQVMATRSAQTAPTNTNTNATGAGSDAPATRWQRAASDTPANAPAWSLRSTVTLDPRFPAGAQAGHGAAHAVASAAGRVSAPALADEAMPGATGERAAIGGASPAPAAAGGPSPQADMAGSTDGGDTSETPPDSGSPGDDAQADQAGDTEAVEVQHWSGAHGLRHASLRVGEDAARAIDIQLALRGDEVQLDIRTDDSAARDALREQAQAALGERLQQGGLQLGNVSVGAQQQERQPESQAPTVRAGLKPDDDSADAAALQRPGTTERTTDRTGGLDLFI